MTKSLMQHSFSDVPRVEVQRSAFDRSQGYKSTFDAGWLIPFFADEALPGDTFKMNATIFGRLATPLTPVMDNLWMDTFWFAVPNRLIWDNWHKFCGAQDNPSDSVDFTVPQMPAPTTTGFATGSIADYIGIPIKEDGFSINSLHHRAYSRIWNEWFRDQNLQSSAHLDVNDGPDDESDYPLRRRNKRHDYFTSSLPWPQKGDSISVPLLGTAKVTGLGKYNQTYGAGNVDVYETEGSAYTTYASCFSVESSSDSQSLYVEQDPNNTGYPNIRADMSTVSATTINDLREAFALQKMAEKDALGGSRYTEIVKMHFGVSSPDSRLQRSEFLGGGSVRINIQEVAQTSETGTTPQGTMTGYGTMTLNNDGFMKSFSEHCVILGLVNVRADLTYQQGLPRMFSRQTKYDFYWPTLAHLGEQAVLNKEIYCKGDANDDLVFGYQERYAEYRYAPSKITGLFRSTATTPLHIWHLSQEFTSLPTLSDAWIQDDPPVDRVIAVTSEPHIIFDSYMKLKCVRPMPTYAVPGMIDRF